MKKFYHQVMKVEALLLLAPYLQVRRVWIKTLNALDVNHLRIAKMAIFKGSKIINVKIVVLSLQLQTQSCRLNPSNIKASVFN